MEPREASGRDRQMDEWKYIAADEFVSNSLGMSLLVLRPDSVTHLQMQTARVFRASYW